MNSRQLRWILSNDKVTRRTFKGVYALDEIVHIKQKSFPSAYVFNLVPSNKPGSHWVTVYIDRKGRPEYFDSFGRPPPREIKDFLYTCAESWKYNHVLNTLTLLDALPQGKSKTFCIPVQKAGNTITYPFKNFILRHVDNLLCFIFRRGSSPKFDRVLLNLKKV